MMMERKKIGLGDFNLNLFDLYAREWMLLTAGDFTGGEFNAMTISWGMMGYFWNREVVQVGARPQRYTLEFLERYDTFTLSVFPERFRDDLKLLGSESGRDGDKLARTALTPTASVEASAPSYAEAELVIECRKVYSDRLRSKGFADKSIVPEFYPERDLHELITGTVLGIYGTERFIRK